LTAAECSKLLAGVDRLPWDSATLRRRTQQYGYRYDYQSRSVHPLPAAAIPAVLEPVIDRLLQLRVLTARPDQVIVNEYLPGQGIAAHVDQPLVFADGIASVTLGSPCVMSFRRHGEHHPQYLAVGSAVALRREARYSWTHEIAARKSDTWMGRVLPRSRRVSLTFRSMKSVQKQKEEEEEKEKTKEEEDESSGTAVEAVVVPVPAALAVEASASVVVTPGTQ